MCVPDDPMLVKDSLGDLLIGSKLYYSNYFFLDKYFHIFKLTHEKKGKKFIFFPQTIYILFIMNYLL